jgi:hypothetical protein
VKRILALVAVLAVMPVPSRAQVAGPLMEQGDLEAGFTCHWLDRGLVREGESAQFEQVTSVMTFRYGLTGSATFALELAADRGLIGGDAETPLLYTVGGSLQTGVWSCRDFRVTSTLYYAETLASAGVDGASKFWEQNIEWTFVGEYPMTFGDQQVVAWAGPSISHFLVQEREPTNTQEWDSDQMFGLAFGARALLFRHAVLQGHFTWVGDLQSNVFIAYRF